MNFVAGMSRSSYRPDIDGIRAIAVTLVLLFHANLGCSGGFVGVDVFFVISGYLITGLILRQQETTGFSLLSFWIRRIRRIIPASLFLVLCTVIAGYVILFAGEYHELAQSTIAQQLMISNVFFWKTSGYFAGPSELKPLLHTWSLAVEEQFYLGYPFLLVAMRRMPRPTATALMSVFTLFLVVLSEYAVRRHPSAAFYLLPTRAWELLAGALICYVPQPAQSGRKLQLLSWSGIAAIIGSAMCFDHHTRFPGLAALLPVGGTMALIYANTLNSTGIGRILASKPFVIVGLLSYSLYLWHCPILVYARHLYGEDLALPQRIGALMLSLLCACISWRFVEQPFRSGSSLPSSKRVFVMASATTVMTICIAFVIVACGGLPDRLDPRASAYAEAREHVSFRTQVGLEDVQNGEVPRFGVKEGSLKCLIWGDSHAQALVFGLDAACKEEDVDGFQATYSSTPPLVDFIFKSASGLNEQSRAYSDLVIQFAIENHVDVVVLGGNWSSYSWHSMFESCLTHTVQRLTKAGIQVVVVLDVAQQDADVPLMLATAVRLHRYVEGLGVSTDLHNERNKVADTVIRGLAGSDVTIVDPADVLVDTRGLWRAELDGQALYYDDDHLSNEGSLRLKPLFAGLFDRLRSRARIGDFH